MDVPKNSLLIEKPSHVFWYDENGILCAKSFKGYVLTLEEISDTVEFLQKKLIGKKACILLDFSNFSSTTKEIRDYIAIEFPKIAKAVGLLSATPLGRMMANLFFSIRKQPFPVKMFTDEEQAKKWLKQYL